LTLGQLALAHQLELQLRLGGQVAEVGGRDDLIVVGQRDLDHRGVLLRAQHDADRLVLVIGAVHAVVVVDVHEHLAEAWWVNLPSLRSTSTGHARKVPSEMKSA
jgi:hypothetical protein